MAEASDSQPKVGRPSSYTPEIGEEICRRLAEGESLRSICRDEHNPDRNTVVRWLLNQDACFDQFRRQYALGREAQQEHHADEILEISDDGSNDWLERETQHGTITVPDHEHISRSKLRVDTRKWLMARMAPKKYGERVSSEISGPNGGPIETSDTTSLLEFARRAAFLLRRASQPGAKE